MLGGEIYHRAIGRPWGPAADFIVTARLTQVPLGHPPAGPLQWPDHGPPARERSEPLAHSSSSRAGREYSGPPSVGRPPEPSVCRTLSDCLPRAAGLRPVLFRFGTVKKKYQSATTYTHHLTTVTNNCCTKECGAGLADTVWEFTIHTRFGTSPHSELQGLVGGRNILQGHRPALGAGGRLHVKFHPLRRTAVGWPGPLAAGGPGCPRAVGATRAFKFESGRQTRRVLRSTVTIRGPPARPSCPSVPGRPSDSLSAPGRRSARPCAPCARAVRVGSRCCQ